VSDPLGPHVLDRGYGFGTFILGDSLYSSVIDEARRVSRPHDVLEFETFGSRFADQLPFPVREDGRFFGVPIARATAGVFDGQLYAILLQLDADAPRQRVVLDSLIARLGPPPSASDTAFAEGGLFVQVDTRRWEGKRVGLAYGMGEGYAEVLLFERVLRRRRVEIQNRIAEARSRQAAALAGLPEVGTVQLQITEPFATWRYRYEREGALSQDGAVGRIDYALVQPFFEVRGRSLYGLDMASVTLHFLPLVDSLRSLEVRFDNSQAQAVGFVEMLGILERKLGPHAYADTLHTAKGPYRRAEWYGGLFTATLEEHRLRPVPPARADLVVRFDVARQPVDLPPDWRPPGTSLAADTTGPEGGTVEPAYPPPTPESNP
jgi:hypothetical protein